MAANPHASPSSSHYDIPRREARKALAKLKNELEGEGDISHLNITAMMDMMTILLVFMLMQFAAEQASMNMADSLQLPKSTTQLKPTPSVNVTVTTNGIIIEGEQVATVRAGAVDSAIKRDGPNGYYLTPVVDTLQKHANRLKKIDLIKGSNEFEGTMLLLVDRSIPYRLVTEVLYSAGQAEFRNYRLVVLQKQ
jgi:biopolymer transport protein ExbD